MSLLIAGLGYSGVSYHPWRNVHSSCSQAQQEAIRAARRAGAIIHGMPSIKTTVLVRGRPNPLQAAGRDAGRKLIEIKRLQEKGHRITLLDEARFWRLVAPPHVPSKTSGSGQRGMGPRVPPSR